MTVVWHVKDLKISHKKPEEITKLAKYLSKISGDKSEQGNSSWVLGDDAQLHSKGESTGVHDPIENIVKDFSEEIASTVTTPAVEHLFQIQDQNKGTCFHHTIAQLLFVSAMARQDIQTSVAFSTTRVKGPDEDDWGKLKMVLKYLNGTKPLKLTIHAWKLDVVKWYVDALCTIHDDCKGHTWAMMTLGKGVVMISLGNRNWMQKAPLRLNSLESMMPWLRSYRQDTLLQHGDIHQRKTLFTKMINIVSLLKKENHPVQKELNTLR